MSIFGFHYKLERKAMGLVLGIIVVASIGGLVEIAPLFTIHTTVEDVPDMRLYTPLELAGRNIYIREGCYACHSQMIRTLRDEVDRYGPYSLANDAKGNSELGAPNLTDKLWIYGGDFETVDTTIWGGRQGHMPTWETRAEP